MKHLALFTLLTLTIGNAEASSSLVGSWYDGDNLVTFFDNGEYLLAHDGRGANDPADLSGLEYGAYSWNELTGGFNATDTVNTTGAWQAVPTTSRLSVTGDTLSANNGEHTLSRVTNVSDSIVGSWVIHNPGQAQGAAVVTFLANSEFFMAQAQDSALDPSGQSGIERGTYTWDSATGAFTDIVLLDTNGEWGLSHSSITGVTVTGNQMAISFLEKNGSVTTRTTTGLTAPIPLPGALWFFMTGFIGWVYSVKKNPMLWNMKAKY